MAYIPYCQWVKLLLEISFLDLIISYLRNMGEGGEGGGLLDAFYVPGAKQRIVLPKYLELLPVPV